MGTRSLGASSGRRAMEVITSTNLDDVAEVGWFRTQFRRLYGFDVASVDYTAPVEPDQAWPIRD